MFVRIVSSHCDLFNHSLRPVQSQRSLTVSKGSMPKPASFRAIHNSRERRSKLKADEMQKQGWEVRKLARQRDG
jgi:hypothetical protein